MAKDSRIKSIHIISLVFLELLHRISAECVFDQYSYQDSGIFLQQFDGQNTIVNFQGNPIRIPDQGNIEAVCSSGFRFPGHPKIFSIPEKEQGQEFEDYTNISILCQNGDMTYSFPGGLKQEINGNKLICKDCKARFYKTQIAHCDSVGLLYGFVVKDVPVIAAELCYNVDDEKTLFVHFVGGKRTSLLQGQGLYNPSEVSTPLQTLQKFVFPMQAEYNKLREKIFKIPGYKAIAEYKLEYLTPIANFTTIFGNLVNNFELPNLIPMWTTLKNYNWRIFEELLRKELDRQNYEIYSGSSGSVIYPFEIGGMAIEEFLIVEEAAEISVPLHIWYYMNAKNATNTTAGAVIVAVNTPIMEMGPAAVICEDICDSLAWLKPLNKTRKISSLGYMYCCKPQAVANILEGFPKLEMAPSAPSTPPAKPGSAEKNAPIKGANSKEKN